MNPVLHGIQLTDLVYGSPNVPQIKKIQDQGKALRALYNDPVTKQRFFNKPYPSNVSPEVRRELETLQKQVKNISGPDLEFAKQSEKDHYGMWIQMLYNHGISVQRSWFETITDNTDGLLYALKYHYNRPRPFQLGHYHKIQVTPTIYTNANSPAFPSGHSMEARLFALVLSQKHPFLADKIMNMSDRISKSRMDAGVHYESDLAFGHEIAQWIFSTKCF